MLKTVEIAGLLNMKVGTLAIAMLCCLMAPSNVKAKDQDQQKPSVIIVNIDTLRASNLGTYGYHRPTSPNIDQFANQAVQFNWAFAQAPNTPPSQTSILTSLYPSTHGMVLDSDTVDPSLVTLAEALKEAGYRTTAFVDGGYMRARWGIDQGFDTFIDVGGGGLAAIEPRVTEWVKTTQKDQPFLLLIHTYDTHTPYDSPAPHRSMFSTDLPPPAPDFEASAAQMEGVRMKLWSDRTAGLQPNDLQNAIAWYDGGINYVDEWFGRLTSLLKSEKRWDDAVIIFVSDHGEAFQENDSLLHERLLTTVTHIPLLVRTPGMKDSQQVNGVVQSIDIMPTVLDLADVEPPDGIAGRSLVPLIQGKRMKQRFAYGESPFWGGRFFIADDEHQLIYHASSNKTELYRYRTDPLALEDLSATSKKTTDRLLRELMAWKMSLPRKITPTKDTALDSETEQQLRELGYVE